MRLVFIGGGNMGEAMLSTVLNKRLAAPPDISVSDTSEVRRQHIAQEYGVHTTASNTEIINRGDVVVLAIKPQNLDEVMAELKGRLKPEQLVLSIIAGARINTLSLGLNHDSVVRAMPNTPAQIGMGVSVWATTVAVTKQQKGWVSSILGAMGKEIYIDDEQYIDMATAVSGSGPAYVFLFMESLVKAAVHIGLPRNIARELVLETLLGSGHLVQKSGKEPSELRRMVTSPGGTTAEALLQFEKAGFSALVLQAVTAAYDKSRRLGD